ncbi:MAG: 1,4-alpha-glucan branching protein GlgB [Candidatus Electryoneaceae bacterium]|nr:1,4-alpha-glucan branching protein GlgB [Candidatus Electryoneaceae bacterium]
MNSPTDQHTVPIEPIQPNHPAVQQLCRMYGIQTIYTDGLNQRRQASPEALLSVLNSLGATIKSHKDVTKALRRQKLARWEQVIEPIILVWDKGKLPIRLRLPDNAKQKKRTGNSTIKCRLTLENNDTQHWSIQIDDLPVRRTVSVDGKRFIIKRWIIPTSLPHGYHRLTLEISGNKYNSLVISAPTKAYSSESSDGKQWGLFCPTYALHSGKSWGGGDLADLEKFRHWHSEQGAKITATLPMLAQFLDEPYDPSPYSPASRLFWNEFYIDIHRIPEFESCQEAQSIYHSSQFQAEIEKLRSARMVDYHRQMALKRKILEQLAKTFFSESSTRRTDFDLFVKKNPVVKDYARFRAVGERHKSAWHNLSQSLQNGNISTEDYDSEAEQYHLYVQWLIAEQMEKLLHDSRKDGGQLYLDLPLGVNYNSFDVWRNPDLFALDVSTGAPPDLLFIDGQNWGFPPIHPDAIRRQGYSYFIDYLRNYMQHADMLRIDHVMGLHRLFWIPKDMDATDGMYVQYHSKEMYAILSLESHRNHTTIVGEDLGTVPKIVRNSMKRHNFKRMYILQFALTGNPEKGLEEVPPGTVASMNTHDMPPFAAFWHDKDIDDLVELGLYTGDQAKIEKDRRHHLKQALIKYLHNQGLLPMSVADDLSILKACLDFLGRSNASTVLINIEDLWLETKPQNVPGTSVERPNWQRKIRQSLDQFEPKPLITEILHPTKPYQKIGSTITTDSPDPKHRSVTIRTLLTKDDLYLFNEGTHHCLYEKMGAHITTRGKQSGTYFSVWAPNAEQVSVIGSFNGWNRDVHRLNKKGQSGIWEGFIAGVTEGSLYKFFIRSRYKDYEVEKGDPFAFFSEIAPKSASIVWNLDYEWGDQQWMTERHRFNSHYSPISIYEVHLGSWKRILNEGNRSLSYRELAHQLADYVHEMGFTHVEFLPVTEHPFFGSWGYQTTGFFSPTSRYGTPQDFMYLIDHLHREGIGVLIDWVPSHFPSDEYALGYFDGTHLYEHADPKQGFHPDWKSLVFNYDRNEVRSFLISSGLFWFDKYHVDGLRVDAVASMLHLDYSRKTGEWVPNKYGGSENLGAITFLRHLNDAVNQEFPNVLMIAEESASWPAVTKPTHLGGLGFDMKWDMGWMHDTLDYMRMDPLLRKYQHNNLTFRQMYVKTENFVLSLSHDEVVHMKGSLIRKMSGDDWQKFANLRLLYGLMYGQSGKKLIFMGNEIGQWSEWNHDGEIDWHALDNPFHRGMQNWVADLNHNYRCESALYRTDFDTSSFEWIDCNDFERSIISFLRKSESGDEIIIAVFNFTPVIRQNYRIGCPTGRYWREMLNSDGIAYGGSGVGNFGGVYAKKTEQHGRPYSLNLTLPPLGVVFLKNQ